MTRSIIREHIFKILFRAEFYNKEELIQQTDYYVSELSNAKDKEIEYRGTKVKVSPYGDVIWNGKRRNV